MKHPVDNRPDVPLSDIARACGISGYSLLNSYRPDDWCTPRDFIWRGTVCYYALASLPRLADHLESQGATDAALLLRKWATTQLERQRHTDQQSQELKSIAVQRELLAGEPTELTPELEAVNRSAGRRSHPSDRESSRFDWEE
jgi:hypothetical protein